MSILPRDRHIAPSSQQHLLQRRAVWVSLTLTIAIDTIQQLSWKAATFSVAWDASIWQTLITTFLQPLIIFNNCNPTYHLLPHVITTDWSIKQPSIALINNHAKNPIIPTPPSEPLQRPANPTRNPLKTTPRPP